MSPVAAAAGAPSPAEPDRRFCVAPMMGRTDLHFRWLVRLFCSRVLLFTEMLTCRAVLFAPQRRAEFLAHEPQQGPVVLQLAGAEPADFAAVAPLAEAAGFAEINLNIGCPSRNAGAGCFGAVLMRDPGRVAELVAAARGACTLPVTVKTRLGVDELDSDAHLAHFLDRVRSAGCRTFYLHARKALLSGISPAMNRRIPPLDYGRAERMRDRFGDLELVVNGGICDWPQALELMQSFAGVMVGRGAYIDLPLLLRADRWLQSADSGSTAGEIPGAEALTDQFRQRLQSANRRRVRVLAGHLAALFRALPGARRARRQIAEAAPDAERLVDLLPSLPWQQLQQKLAA